MFYYAGMQAYAAYASDAREALRRAAASSQWQKLRVTRPRDDITACLHRAQRNWARFVLRANFKLLDIGDAAGHAAEACTNRPCSHKRFLGNFIFTRTRCHELSIDFKHQRSVQGEAQTLVRKPRPLFPTAWYVLAR